MAVAITSAFPPVGTVATSEVINFKGAQHLPSGNVRALKYSNDAIVGLLNSRPIINLQNAGYKSGEMHDLKHDL